MRKITCEAGTWMPATLSVREAAEVIGCHPKRAYQRISAGTFPVETIRVGHSIRVPTWALMRFVRDPRATAQ